MPLERKNGKGAGPGWDRLPFRIVAFDPGGTTGWAICQYTGESKLPQFEEFDFTSGQIGPQEHHSSLWAFLNQQLLNADNDGIPLEIVWESFQFRQHINAEHAKTKVELISCEYIGLLKLFCNMQFVPHHEQTASSAKTFIPDKGPQAHVKIKQLGLWVPGQTHAMDAYRHLLKHMIITKRIRTPITDRWL